MNIQCNLIWEFMLYEFRLGDNAAEAAKNICYAKDESTFHQNIVSRWLKNSARFAWISTIRQGQVALKVWITLPIVESAVHHYTVSKNFSEVEKNLDGQEWWGCAPSHGANLLSNIWRYQASSASHNSAWFVTFTTSAKASRAVKFCITLPKYCKTFDPF